MAREKTITKRQQFIIIRAVRQQFMALQAAVRAEDRERADALASEISTAILDLKTNALEAQLAAP
jgi:hypothetical protein